ncbi:MAG: hypothetical protein IKH28_12150 [Lachnospiraceae bacterium]|nr:hypothetical protein [Lachnospiraceae bacterium]
MSGSKRRIIYGLLLVALLLLAGCRRKGEEAQTEAMPWGISAREAAQFEFVDDVELEWKDNSLDELQAVINCPLEEVKADGEQVGGRKTYVVGEGGAVRFKNHLVGSYKKDWSGVSGVTTSGEAFSERITVDPDYVGVQLDFFGTISGKAGYVATRNEYDEEYNIIGRWFYELNESFEKVNAFYVKLPFGGDVLAVMGDKDGNIHLTFFESADCYKYFILSPEGETLFETSGNFREGLRAFGDGRVTVCEIVTEGGRMTGKILEADPENGTVTELGKLSAQQIYDETKGREIRSFSLTPVSEKLLAWCGSEGLYFCNVDGGETRMAYRWASHGITVQGVADLYAKEDGTVAVIYQDESGMNYLLLKPTTEKTDIKTITLATVPFHKEDYVRAAALFNRKYPAYNIEVRDDYDATSLLVQLGAGSGPVLVDTALTGFEELERLWQPMDGFLEKSGLAEELIPQATEFGRIGERTYGIVTSFFIRALIVSDPAVKDWDYEGFLNAAEGTQSAVFTATWFDTPSDERAYFFDVLGNGLYDNAYFDLEKGTSVLGTKDFDRVLRIAEKARACPRTEDNEEPEGIRALCELLTVNGAEGLVRLRARREAGENVMGYPTKDGARYLLSAQNPITVRCTATDEEKKIAYTFLKILLSKESVALSVKGNTYSQYSVRKDALEEQFDHYERVAGANAELGAAEPLPKLDREKDELFYAELLQNSVVQKSFPPGLQDAFDEELNDYLKGNTDAEAFNEHLKSRTWLYLQEQSD